MPEAPRAVGGWTGGQYSLVRALTALLAAPHFLAAEWAADRTLAWAATALAAVLLTLFLTGLRTRTAALLLAALEAARLAGGGGAATAESGWAALLLLHVFVPSAPYGSVDARGRVDPRGAWRMRYAVLHAGFIGALVHVGWRVAGELPGPDGVLLLAAWLFLGVPPLLLGPARPGGTARVYYDGACGLCHGAVRFLLAEDRDGAGFRYAPLDSEGYRAALPAELREAMPETMVVLGGDDEARARSRGVLFLASALGGWWRLLGGLGRLLPRRVADFLYDRVAAVRHRWFRRPEAACPLLPDDLRARFDLS